MSRIIELDGVVQPIIELDGVVSNERLLWKDTFDDESSLDNYQWEGVDPEVEAGVFKMRDPLMAQQAAWVNYATAGTWKNYTVSALVRGSVDVNPYVAHGLLAYIRPGIGNTSDGYAAALDINSNWFLAVYIVNSVATGWHIVDLGTLGITLADETWNKLTCHIADHASYADQNTFQAWVDDVLVYDGLTPASYYYDYGAPGMTHTLLTGSDTDNLVVVADH